MKLAPLLRALLLTSCAGAALSLGLCVDTAAGIALALVAVLLGAGEARSQLRGPGLAAVGAAAGLLLRPPMNIVILVLGHWLGLHSPLPVPPPFNAGTAAVALLFSPMLEELLYRGIWLDAFRPLGAPVAVLASSALFAFFHLTPWALLGTFLVGLVLGCVAWRTRCLGLCAGIHAGLNAGAWLTLPLETAHATLMG